MTDMEQMSRDFHEVVRAVMEAQRLVRDFGERYIFEVPSSPINDVIKAVCDESGVTRNELLGPSRMATFVLARHVAMWLCSVKGISSLSEIGRVFNRDHTSVLHGVRRVDLLRHEKDFRARTDRLKAELEG